MKRKITTLWSPRDGDQKTQEVKQVRFCETPFPLLASVTPMVQWTGSCAPSPVSSVGYFSESIAGHAYTQLYSSLQTAFRIRTGFYGLWPDLFTTLTATLDLDTIVVSITTEKETEAQKNQ